MTLNERSLQMNPGWDAEQFGTMLLGLFQRKGSIATNKRAVESIPDDHPDRAEFLNNLGNAVQRRFERMGSMDNLDGTTATNEQAIESIPDNHPDPAELLNNWGTRYRGDPKRRDLISITLSY